MKIKAHSRKDNDDFDENFGGEYKEVKKWYQEISPDPSKFSTVTDQILIELKEEAKKCLDSETATFNIKHGKTDPNYRWMKTIMAKGTVSDRIAAYTVLVQNNPVYNLETIRNLIGMVKVGKKKECIAVIETLSDLFLNDLLRPNVKLKPFHQRPLSKLTELSSGNATTRRKFLSYWYFEDQLKECYTTFVQALNTAAHDTVESNKEKSIAAMSKLLAGNPEQEKNLLSNIINKLGDPSQKVASKAMYCLTQLLNKHSNMQGVVLAEVEKLLFRQNIGHKAQYYSLCFLSQFYLNHENPAVARKLIEVYFSFFKKCIKEGDVDSRMMSALLIGVNRAYPYAKLELEKISEHIDTMYRVVHIASFNISLHALTLLFQVSEFSNNVNDRYYSALYKKLMDPKVCTSTNYAMLLNLVYKSMLRDTERSRILAYVKRLLQLCLYAQPSFSCGVLFLISQIISKKKDLNILELKEIKADSDDEDEKYVDIKEEPIEEEVNTTTCEEDEQQAIRTDVEIVNTEPAKQISWNHLKTQKPKYSYNPLARNPVYSGSEFTAYTELCELRNHFHPSVSMFAEKILNRETITYPGDPLKDFTLIRFLDRFVFKNPKKAEDIKQHASFSMFGRRKLYHPKGIRSIPVTSNGYINEMEKNIPVDEMFMHIYLQRRYKDKEINEDDGSDLESVASEDFEEMLDKMSGFKDVDDDIDFMNEIGTSMKNKDKGKKTSDDEDDGSDDQEEVEDEDLDISEDDNASGDEELGNDMDDDLMEDGDEDLFKDLDEDEDADSDIVFGSDSEEEEEENKTGKKKKKLDTGSIFASAEEFASLLEEEGSSKKKPGSASQFANKDKADVKQLDWEEKRNRWLTGYKTAVGKGDFKGVKRKFNNKQGNKFSGSKKKQRN